MADKADFKETFIKLRAILEPYATKMIVVHDTSTNYYLDTTYEMKNKQRMFFGAVRLGKAYVSFHLMPVYCCPDLLGTVSPELKKHMLRQVVFQLQSGRRKVIQRVSETDQGRLHEI